MEDAVMWREPAVLLAECGAVREGHFVLSSGLHSGKYVNKDALYPNTLMLADMVSSISAWVGKNKINVEVVVGPEKGGILLASYVAQDLTHRARIIRHMSNVLAIYAEKSPTPPCFGIRRSFQELIEGRRVLVVEDNVTTGTSAKEVVRAVRRHGGIVEAVAAIVNRGGVTAETIDVPVFHALVDMPIETWAAEDCPLCRAGVPIDTDLGHGSSGGIFMGAL